MGSAAALVAQALGRAAPAAASDGQTVVVGGEYAATSVTKFTIPGGDALMGVSGSGYGVYGISDDSLGVGVRGESFYGLGVHGKAATGVAVRGESNGGGTGVYGTTAAGSGDQAAVRGRSYATVGGVPGVWGQAASATGRGVFGETTDTGSSENYGVLGITRSSLGRGVFGWNQNSVGGTGVWGQTNAPLGAGVRGYAWDGGAGSGQFGTGVIGTSGSHAFPPPAAKSGTGVYGYAAQNANSRGVWGQTTTGQGVRGEATSGYGVRGVGSTGIGIGGYATSGVALQGQATTGYALATDGRIKLTKSAGQATVANGASSVTVTPGIDLAATSAVLATLNGDAGGSTTVRRVAIDTTANTFTIYLTAAATASVKLAWLVHG